MRQQSDCIVKKHIFNNSQPDCLTFLVKLTCETKLSFFLLFICCPCCFDKYFLARTKVLCTPSV